MTAEVRRPSFRGRLVRTLGLALGVALMGLSVLVLLGAWGLMNNGAREVLEAEARNIEAHVMRRGGLDLDAYPWNEPHHRFAERHIDPYFVQIFDPAGRPLRSSPNVAHLAGFPARRLPTTDEDVAVGPLRTFVAGGARFYHRTTPLATRRGRVLGYLQVSRYAPAIGASLVRLGLSLAVGYAVVLAGLLALLWVVGGRVVRPLEAMTDAARALSPAHLGQRVPVAAGADRETAALGHALNDALEQLERAFGEVRRFTADAAHELQTPLTVLLGHIEVALRRERDPAAYRETLRLLQAEAKALTRMVRGLLTLARLEGAPLPAETVALGPLVEEEAAAAQARAAAKGLTLRLAAPPGLDVAGHPALLREAVRNLIDNAVKYTDAGEVRVGLARSGSRVTLSVEDTGVGIAAEHLPHVTRRFWRADGVQHLPGSGLGLALVQRVAEAHGGQLHIASAPGQGTTVRLALPLAAPSPARQE